MALVAVAVLSVTACSSPDPAGQTTPATTPRTGTTTVKLGDRSFTLHVPSAYTAGRAMPLLILLHGYTATGQNQESYMKFTPESDARGFLYAYPDGLVDSRSNNYWNATDACCDLYGSKVDDSAYLSNVITAIERAYTVDTKRVYLAGHSNGAFMSFRMACDHADQVTAIATLNGAMWQDASRCTPTQPVSVLDIRSTSDETIAYQGGSIAGNAYPSAAKTDADWLAFDHCSSKGSRAPSLDLVTNLTGAETTVTRYTDGCRGGSTVETWTIDGGMHVPAFSASFASMVMGFLLARAKT